jgi:hypothetical protein
MSTSGNRADEQPAAAAGAARALPDVPVLNARCAGIPLERSQLNLGATRARRSEGRNHTRGQPRWETD